MRSSIHHQTAYPAKRRSITSTRTRYFFGCMSYSRYNPRPKARPYGPLLTLRRRAQSSGQSRTAFDRYPCGILVSDRRLVPLDHRSLVDPNCIRAGLAWPLDRRQQAGFSYQSGTRFCCAGMDVTPNIREAGCNRRVSLGRQECLTNKSSRY